MEDGWIKLDCELLREQTEKNGQKVKHDIATMEEKLKHEVPSKERLYMHVGVMEETYFDDVGALIKHIGFDWFTTVMILDYIGDFGGKKDVIRKTYIGDIAYMTESENGKSIYRRTKGENNEPDWIELGGDLHKDYEALQNHGVVLEKDQGKKPLQKIK